MSRRPQFPLIVAVLALTFGAVGTAVMEFDSSARDPQPQMGFVAASESPAVADLRTHEQLLEQLAGQALEGADVSPEVIRELAEMTTDLDAKVREFGALDGRSRRELQRAIREQFLLLQLIVGSRLAADVAPAANQALELTEDLAEEWGVDLPETPVATVAASPSPVATLGPTQGATPSAGTSASPTPTPAVETAPTPAPPSAAPELP